MLAHVSSSLAVSRVRHTLVRLLVEIAAPPTGRIRHIARVTRRDDGEAERRESIRWR